MITKRCLACGLVLEKGETSAERFAYRHKKYCSPKCRPKYKIEYKRYKHHAKKYQIKMKFGLSIDEYTKLTKKCYLCDFSRVVDLHHLNGKSDNKHLIGLCPNHHRAVHYKLLTSEETERLKHLSNN